MQEFSSTQEMLKHYSEVRRRLGLVPPPPKPKPREVVIPPIQPAPPVVVTVRPLAILRQRPLAETPPNMPMRTRLVVEAVALRYEVDPSAVFMGHRHQKVSLVRQIAIYFLNVKLELTQPQIGRQLDRDHSTVLHAVRKITRLADNDPHFRQQLEELWDRIWHGPQEPLHD